MRSYCVIFNEMIEHVGLEGGVLILCCESGLMAVRGHHHDDRPWERGTRGRQPDTESGVGSGNDSPWERVAAHRGGAIRKVDQLNSIDGDMYPPNQPKRKAELGASSANSKLVSQEVKMQTVQGQTAQKF